MKRRPMTWGRWVELICGPVLATIIFAPLLFFAAIIGTISQKYGWVDFVMWAVWLFVSAGGLASIFSLWRLVLLGPEEINRYPPIRRFTIATGFIALAGILVGIYVFLMSTMEKLGGSRYLGVFLFLLTGLIGPCVIWLRYLPRLLRGANVER